MKTVTALPEADLRHPPGQLQERLRAAAHRVATEDRVKLHYSADRISVPTLSLAPDLAARATPLADPSDPIFSVYGRNAWKSRLRAHPDVAAAYGYSSGG